MIRKNLIRKNYKLIEPFEHGGRTISRVAIRKPTQKRLLTLAATQAEAVDAMERDLTHEEFAEILLAVMTDIPSPQKTAHRIGIDDATALVGLITNAIDRQKPK